MRETRKVLLSNAAVFSRWVAGAALLVCGAPSYSLAQQ